LPEKREGKKKKKKSKETKKLGTGHLQKNVGLFAISLKQNSTVRNGREEKGKKEKGGGKERRR